MARREPPEELRAPIAAHLAGHGLEYAPELVGAKTARASTAVIRWDAGKGDEGGASFLCSLCRDGYDRFYAEVENAVPSRRLVRRTQDHFPMEHPERPPLREEEIYHEANRCENARAVFFGATPATGASMRCRECPPGGDLHYLSEAPAGDARRISYLLRTKARFRERGSRRGYTKELADYVVAWDRGMIAAREEREAASALRHAHPREHQPDTIARQEAVAAAVRARVAEGVSATAAREQLAQFAQTDAVAFLCALGEHIPALALTPEPGSPRKFAKQVAAYLKLPAEAPVLSERTLRRYSAARS